MGASATHRAHLGRPWPSPGRASQEFAVTPTDGQPVRDLTHFLEGLRVARRLLDRYEDLWRGRIDRMTELVTTDPKEMPR